MAGLDKLVEHLREKRVFKRNKRSLRTKEAFLPYQNGLSYKEIADQIGLETGKRPSKASAYRWVRKIGDSLETSHERKRREVYVDKTKLKLRGEHIFCWTAIDDERKLLAIGASGGRSSLEALRFLGKLRERCEEGSIIYTDGGKWYPWACERLRFEHTSVDFGENNRVERLFRTLKDRTRRFYHSFAKKAEKTLGRLSSVKSCLKHICERLESWSWFYSHLRFHESLGGPPMGFRGVREFRFTSLAGPLFDPNTTSSLEIIDQSNLEDPARVLQRTDFFQLCEARRDGMNQFEALNETVSYEFKIHTRMQSTKGCLRED